MRKPTLIVRVPYGFKCVPDEQIKADCNLLTVFSDKQEIEIEFVKAGRDIEDLPEKKSRIKRIVTSVWPLSRRKKIISPRR